MRVSLSRSASSFSFSDLRGAMVNSRERDQRRLGTSVIFLACEQGMRGRKQLQCSLPGTFLVAAAKLMKFLPRRRFDDGHRNFEQLDRRFKGAKVDRVNELRCDAVADFDDGASATDGAGIKA